MTGRVLVVGAGAVGSRVARGLIASERHVEVLVADLDASAALSLASNLGDRVGVAEDIDPTEQAGPGRPLPDVVVLAQPRPHGALVERLVSAGIPVVSTSDDRKDVAALVDLDPFARRRRAPLVVGAAMSPGLSGLVARYLADQLDVIDEIHVAIHGTGGPACARQHHRALAGSALAWHDRAWIERPAGSGRELCWFPDPLGAKDCYRADLADPVTLVHAFPELVRASARLSATRRDRLTARLPMLTPPHAEGGLGGLRVEIRGDRAGERMALVAGVAERTGIVAAHVATVFALAALNGELAPGVVLAGQAGLDTVGLLERLRAAGLALREFVGTDSRPRS